MKQLHRICFRASLTLFSDLDDILLTLCDAPFWSFLKCFIALHTPCLELPGLLACGTKRAANPTREIAAWLLRQIEGFTQLFPTSRAVENHDNTWTEAAQCARAGRIPIQFPSHRTNGIARAAHGGATCHWIQTARSIVDKPRAALWPLLPAGNLVSEGVVHRHGESALLSDVRP